MTTNYFIIIPNNNVGHTVSRLSGALRPTRYLTELRTPNDEMYTCACGHEYSRLAAAQGCDHKTAVSNKSRK